MSKLPVIVLAAGESTRMFPLDSTGHKSMLTMCGQSLLSRTLTNLAQFGYTKIYLVVNKNGSENNQLRAWISTLDPQFLDVTLIIQEPALGMGHALVCAKDQAPELEQADTFGVVGAYTLQAGETLSKLEQNTASHTIVVTQTDEPWNYGIVQIENTIALSLVEKPTQGTEPSDLKIQLAYKLDRSFWATLESTEQTEWNFESTLDTFMHQGQVGAVQIDDSLPTLKYSWNLFAFLRLLLDSQEKTSIHASAKVAKTTVIDDSKGAVVIDEGATVSDFVKIVGPAYIGKNAYIGDYSLIRESAIETGASVGAQTEIARSILMPGSSIHFSYLADSILAENVKIGAGLITANKRLDRNQITTLLAGKMVETKKKAFGSVIGSNSKIGIGVKIMPGVLIAANSHVLPGEILTKNIM